MRLSQLYTRTRKEVSEADPSRNAQLLTKAGFVSRLMAGAYTFQPLGLRVLHKIEQIIREEMDALGANEVLMPALQPREIWDATQRWDSVDVLFKLKGAGDRDLCLGPTHEEVVTPLVTQYIHSYRDLPQAVYQIQTKFRNEARAKSGLLRGREFRMKDRYSFHADQADLDAFYERATAAYQRVYARLGIGDRTLLTYASGGMFSRFSHEFQTLTEYGEDTVYRVPGTNLAINKEIIGETEALAGIVPNYKSGMEKEFEEVRAIEVGNIFKLSTRFSDAIKASYMDEQGKPQSIFMGCYGIGPSRILGTIVEVLADDKGLVWPEAVAPYRLHLVSLVRESAELEASAAIVKQLEAAHIEVLWDDRVGVSAGEKFKDADLIGCPHRVVISAKTLAAGQLEYKGRGAQNAEMLTLPQLLARLAQTA
jgi:prolyl-tRNA synthetase